MSVRDLLKDAPSLAAATVVGVLLAALGYWAFAQDRTPKTPTHMHCPACLEEINYNPRLVGKKCTNCDEGAVYAATVGPRAEANDAGGAGRIVLFVLAVAVGVQGLVVGGTKRFSILRERAANERNRMMLACCPFCQRKVTYPLGKSGSWTTCYQCKTAFALPGAKDAQPA